MIIKEILRRVSITFKWNKNKNIKVEKHFLDMVENLMNGKLATEDFGCRELILGLSRRLPIASFLKLQDYFKSKVIVGGGVGGTENLSVQQNPFREKNFFLQKRTS